MLLIAYALLTLTSQNALGSCPLRSCNTVEGLNQNIKHSCPLGNKGIMATNIIQPVSTDALSASSTSSDSETSCLTRSTLTLTSYKLQFVSSKLKVLGRKSKVESWKSKGVSFKL